MSGLGKPQRPRRGNKLWCSLGKHFVALGGFYLKTSAAPWKDGTPATLSWCKGCVIARKKARLRAARRK